MVAAVAAAIALAVCPGTDALGASIIVRRAGEGALSALADTVSDEVKKKPGAASPRIVEMTGDPIADRATIEREAKQATVVYAVGADATNLVGDLPNAAIIALGIANPAKVKTSGTYLSVYPRLDRVFTFLEAKLGARRVGFLHTPTQNGEMALLFAKAAQARGLTFNPIPVSSPGELARALKDELPKIDVLLLAVDPLLFDRRNLEAIVAQSIAQKKPAVGFLRDLTALGVPVCLVSSPGEVAAKAVELSEFTGIKGKKRVEIDSALVFLSRKSSTALNLSQDLGTVDGR